VPADTPEEYWRRSVYYPLLDHIANELETRLVVPKDRFLAQYFIPSKLASLTSERELQVCMPFAGDLPNNNFAAYENTQIILQNEIHVHMERYKIL
jgi:Mlc titration factor MtfA (ptsG expression regulator)